MIDEIRTTLLPCPFCGHDDLILEEHPPHKHMLATWIPDHPGNWTVECPECSAGFCRPTKEGAIDAWNRRPA